MNGDFSAGREETLFAGKALSQAENFIIRSHRKFVRRIIAERIFRRLLLSGMLTAGGGILAVAGIVSWGMVIAAGAAVSVFFMLLPPVWRALPEIAATAARVDASGNYANGFATVWHLRQNPELKNSPAGRNFAEWFAQQNFCEISPSFTHFPANWRFLTGIIAVLAAEWFLGLALNGFANPPGGQFSAGREQAPDAGISRLRFDGTPPVPPGGKIMRKTALAALARKLGISEKELRARLTAPERVSSANRPAGKNSGNSRTSFGVDKKNPRSPLFPEKTAENQAAEFRSPVPELNPAAVSRPAEWETAVSAPYRAVIERYFASFAAARRPAENR